MRHLEILDELLNQKKRNNSSYSNNAFARDLGISGAFLSSILNGRKEIPSRLAYLISERLDMDNFTRNIFFREILKAKYEDSIFKSSILDLSDDLIDKYLPLLTDDTDVLNKWYYIAVLELINTSEFYECKKSMGDSLGISEEEIEEALLILEKESVVKRDSNGKLYKVSSHIRIPTKRTSKIIRDFHSQMITKALDELSSNTETDMYNDRLISGITFTANPENLQKCKQELEEAIHRISSKFSEGECSRVYQLNIQLFPLTKKRE